MALTDEQRRKIIEELAQREKFSVKNILRRYRISRTTLWRLREEAIRASVSQRQTG